MQKAVLLWLALVWVMGCGPGKLKLDGPASGNSDYADELDDWTRSRSLYDHFETRAVVYATFYSPRFIAAYLAEYERIYSPTDEEFQEVRLKIKERAARKDCFFMAVYTGNRDWNDFALSESIWRVYLVTSDGGKLKSLPIREVKDSNQIYHHFFPYFDPFFEGFEVCFAASDSATPDAGPIVHGGLEWFEYQLKSPVGDVSLRWELVR